MKTNNVPALITLSAAAVYCIIGLTSKVDSLTFVKELLIVIIIFYIIGIIVKIILDKNFKGFGDADGPETSEENQDEEIREKEDISTEEEAEDTSSDE